MLKEKCELMIQHSVYSLTARINDLIETNSLDEIKKIIEKEMGNYYNSSHLCFSIEDSIDLIYNKFKGIKFKQNIKI